MIVFQISLSDKDAAEYFKRIIIKRTSAKYVVGGKKVVGKIAIENLKSECLKDVVALMETLDEQTQRFVAMQRINEKYSNSIMLAVASKNYKLIIVLIKRIGVEGFESFLKEHDLLAQAILSGKDKFLESVLVAYSKMPVSLNKYIAMLPENAQKSLKKRSWGTNVLKLMYDHTDTFFIPRGQRKAKMHALVAHEADGCNDSGEDAENTMIQALEAVGFKVKHSPQKDLDTEDIISHMRDSIIRLKEQSSILVVCLSVYESRSGAPSISDRIQAVAKLLPSHVPKVS